MPAKASPRPEARNGGFQSRVSSTQALLHRRQALQVLERRGSDGGTELKLGEGAGENGIIQSTE